MANFSPSLDAFVVFLVGIDLTSLAKAALASSVACPIYLTESCGIIGYNEDLWQNIEIMEKGCGSEYGFVGGGGGSGCLVAGFSGGSIYLKRPVVVLS